jgi:hypothetical protein
MSTKDRLAQGKADSVAEPHSSALTTDGISAALDEARQRLAKKEERVLVASHERDIARKEVELLEQLAALRRGTLPIVSVPAAAVPDAADPPRRRQRAGAHNHVVAAVAEELGRVGRPLHISEIMKFLTEKGVELPGAGRPANVIGLLAKDERIVRSSRGMYARAGQGFDVEARVKPAVRRRARGPSKSKSKKESV